MAPKMNSKAAAAKDRKAGAAAEKEAANAAAAEAAEAQEWSKGAKGKGGKEDKAAKAAEAAARKAEAARLLAEEEASIKTVKAAPKAGAKKAAAKPSVPSFDDGLDSDPKGKGRAAVEEYSASNIDDALDALSIATAKTDKASVGSRAAIAVDAHPERRYKAAFEAYKEKRLPELRKERPGLRLQQMNNEMYDEFKKHPDNPFNQVTVAYDATKADKVAALQADQEAKAARLRSGA